VNSSRVLDFADSQRSFVSFLFGAMLTDLETRINCMSPLGKSRAATTLPGLNWIVTILVLVLVLVLVLAARFCRNFHRPPRVPDHTIDRKSGHCRSVDKHPFYTLLNYTSVEIWLTRQACASLDLDYVIALYCQLLAWMVRAKPTLPCVKHYA
jgi:hypothetical protein